MQNIEKSRSPTRDPDEILASELMKRVENHTKHTTIETKSAITAVSRKSNATQVSKQETVFDEPSYKEKKLIQN